MVGTRMANIAPEEIRRRSAKSVRPVRRSLHDEIADLLRDRIVEGDPAAGEFVNERELAEDFGVSRTPIREALKVLAHEGLVEIVPNRGTFVASLTLEDIADLIEILSEIEGFAARLAAERASAEQLRSMRRLHEDMLAAHEQRDMTHYFKLNQAIHEMVAQAAGNPHVLESFRTYTSRVRRIRFLSNMDDALWLKSIQEHEQILCALEERDATRASELMKYHVEAILAAAEKALAQEEAPDRVG
ncbi:MAG: GntR family transcriptional regulator [Pseudomonadota bacterium]